MITPHLFDLANTALAEIYSRDNARYNVGGGPDDPLLVKLAVRFGWLLLIALGVGLYKLFPNLQRSIGKILLIFGFTLVAPLLAVLWTGHSNDMGDWSDSTKNVILGAFGLGVLLVITGGAFWLVRSKMEARNARLAALRNGGATANTRAGPQEPSKGPGI